MFDLLNTVKGFNKLPYMYVLSLLNSNDVDSNVFLELS